VERGQGVGRDGEETVRLLSPAGSLIVTRSPPTAAPPLSGAEFAAAIEALGPFETAPFLAVAVSGGADSLALAILADRWARKRGGGICALTVDHRLRPESADEARRLHGWLAAREIRHEVLVWREPKPATGIEAAARRARYRLLAGWCRDRGCLHLLKAHHLADQAETYLIRRRAGSGPDGLAGMSAVRELADCRLLRPLLGVAKARLAALLATERQPSIPDPSNFDPAFERARLRAGGGPGSAGPGLEELRSLGAARQARERARDALLARAAILHPAGFGVLDPAPIRAATPAIADRAIAALVTAIGGASYPPRRERIVRLREALAGAGDGPFGRTLGGCRFVAWRGHILLLREAAAVAPVRLTPGSECVWDRRFRLSLTRDAPVAYGVGYLQRAGVGELARRMPGLRRQSLPPLLHESLPAVWDSAGLAAVPGLGYRRDPIRRLPQIVLRPVNCLAGGPFAVVWRSALLMCSSR
jgi:tRNA(Ile)-lysidine synthase